jgi:putative peptide zinc metalloprotease protein
VPRRLVALRASVLGRLPAAALATLAEQARWLHPRTGEQLLFAGGAQPFVYVVVDGALEGRRPGDPTGTVRERVGPGGVVRDPALRAEAVRHVAGTAWQLGWGTAGVVASPLPGPSGNVEFFLWLRRDAPPPDTARIDAVVAP